MKNLTVAGILVLFFGSVLGQSAVHDVVGSAGAHQSSGGVQLSWTVGELSTATLSNGSNQLTQGFHQGGIELITTSNQDLEDVFGLDVFPNPVVNELSVAVRSEQTVHVFLYDQQGKLLTQRIVQGLTTANLDVAHMAMGTYFLTVSDEKGRQLKSFQVLKQR